MTKLERTILQQVYEWMKLSPEGPPFFCPDPVDSELDRQLRIRTRACAMELLFIYWNTKESD